MIYKICTKCKQGYPPTIEYFYRKLVAKDGLQYECKICQYMRAKVYKQLGRVKEAARQHSKNYRQTKAGKQYCEQYRKSYRKTINGHLQDTFCHMKERCSNPSHPSYKNYGGRGIKVCFESAIEFVEYVVKILCVDPRGLQIDRIDNNGDYEKGNIRFVTRSENNLNKRNK